MIQVTKQQAGVHDSRDEQHPARAQLGKLSFTGPAVEFFQALRPFSGLAPRTLSRPAQ